MTIAEKTFLFSFNTAEENNTLGQYFMVPKECNGEIHVTAGPIEASQSQSNDQPYREGEYPQQFIWRFVPFINQRGYFSGHYFIRNEANKNLVLSASAMSGEVELKPRYQQSDIYNQLWTIVPLDNQNGFTVYSQVKPSDCSPTEPNKQLLIAHSDKTISFVPYSDANRHSRIWQLLPERSYFNLVYQGSPELDCLLYINNGLVTDTLFISGFLDTDDPAYTGREESILSLSAGNLFDGDVRFAGETLTGTDIWQQIRNDVVENLSRRAYSSDQQAVIINYIQQQLAQADRASPDYSNNNPLPILWLLQEQQNQVDEVFTTRLSDQQTLMINMALPDNNPHDYQSLSAPFFILVLVKDSGGIWTHRVIDPIGVVGRLPPY